MAGAGVAAVGGYARYAVQRYEDLEPESAGAPGAFLDVDGVRVHYVEAGQGDPVVLIHGWNGSTFSYRYAIAELAQHHRVVALDLKGFGYSARPAGGDYSLTAQAELVRACMDHLGIDRATVAGHSMGGDVAVRFVTRCPERVSRLILIDAATDKDRHRAARFNRLGRPFLPLLAMLTYHRPGFQKRALRFIAHDPAFVTPETLDGHFRPMRMKGHLRAMGAQMAAHRRDEPVDVTAIQQPTLILWGEHDRVIPLERGEELARLIPNAQLVVVPSAGHVPLEEQPDYCNRALLTFLSPARTDVPEEFVPAAGTQTGA
jgi:pimeloyl-ACP methyl ester carboxylesterase